MTYYYESHVTIEPVFDDRRDAVAAIGKRHGFRLALLLMQKRSEDTPERSKHDTFMTAHSTDEGGMTGRIVHVVNELRAAGFKVWRYKLERILLDSRERDDLFLLGE